MDWSADHVGYVVAAYGISAAVLVALAGVNLWRAKNLSATARTSGQNGEKR